MSETGDDLDLNTIRVLSFDCYGTLVDWESGILNAMGPVLRARVPDLGDEAILEAYAEAEARLEGGRYGRYREILQRVAGEMGNSFGVELDESECRILVGSVENWHPFPDTVESLERLKGRYRLAIISNIDDDLFQKTAAMLSVPFDWVITAEQAGSYKPSKRNFEIALERIGRPKEEILHVAQSLYHDIAPARSLGIKNVWVNRREGRKGGGATVVSKARPDAEVPDLRSLVSLLGMELA